MSDTAPDPDEQVVISHPDVTGTGTCTRRQLAEVWAAKGWTEVTTQEAAAVAVADLVSGRLDLDTATKPRLVEAATSAGIDASGTADEIRDRLRAHTPTT